MHRSIIVALCLLFTSFQQVYSQNPFLKKLEEAASKKLSEKGTVMREELDSVDFQFAISLNQGAGFFDVEQKGETRSKLLYSLKEEEDKTAVDRARDSLEIGVGMYGIRRYEMAELMIRATKYKMENDGLTGEIVYLRVLSNLGLICLTQGKTAEAEDHIVEALLRSEDDLGKNSAAYVANLNNYAKLHQISGKYNEAEKAFDEAALHSEEVFGGGMQQAIILNNKAMLYQALGQYDKAIEVMREAIAVSAKAPKKVLQGKKSFDNRKFKANLATLYQVAGNYTEAESLFKELKKIFENRRQTKNAEYAGLVNQLGILYIQMGKTDKVKDLLLTSLNVYRKRWGENNIYFAKTANDLGNFHRTMGRYEEAEKWLKKAWTIRKQLLDPTHPDYIKTQEDLAILYWKTGKYEKAYESYKLVMEKTIDIVNRFFPPMSEAEKTKFWDITSPRFQRFYNLALESHSVNPGIMADVYNYNIATKGLLLSATSKVRNTILRSGDTQLVADYLEWQDKKDQLARLYSYSKSKLKAQNIALAELEEEANDMEKRLSERSSEFSAAFSTTDTDLSTLSALLQSDEVIVDIVRVKSFEQDFTDDVKYLALILQNGASTPEYVVIENGKELESRYAKYYRNAISLNLEDDISFEQFWSTIEPKIVNKVKVFLSPDGVYNQINVNTLKLPEGQFVVDKHQVVLMGNSRDLEEIKSLEGKMVKEAFLLGNPEYGTPKVVMLPGTKIEINDISQILKRGGYTIQQHVEDQATEYNVKAMKSPGIVHIATHGYFKQDVEGTTGSVFGISSDNASDNPLLRSGLILAGTAEALADTLAADISNNDNGILTAYEAMNLDLDDTQLVVLSACETGLGEIKSGEGVYGLQRSFQVAGADALIMSLWKVSDEATQKLMTSFYQNWVKVGDKQSAFRQAQLQLMSEYKEPYYWGAFVMIGG